jgi:hypothetical protein
MKGLKRFKVWRRIRLLLSIAFWTMVTWLGLATLLSSAII